MKKHTILLVEDNPDDVELTLRAFRDSRIHNDVYVARDGQEAIDWLFRTGQHARRDSNIVPDLVLLDLKLPEVNGLDVLARIRADERTRLLPVVILTSSHEERDRFRGYNLGANSYIVKPVDFTQFIDAVRTLELYWLVVNDPPPRGVVVE